MITNTIQYLIYILKRIISIPLSVIYVIPLYRKWNDGVCKKCQSRYILNDYDSDKFFSHIYRCNSCNYKCKSFLEMSELSKEDLLKNIRDNKLNELL